VPYLERPAGFNALIDGFLHGRVPSPAVTTI
jgi:hypothetical protein